MKKIIGTIILVLFVVPLNFSAGEAASERGKGKDDSISRGHVIVKFKAGVSESEKGRARGLVSGRMGRKLKRVGIEKVHIPPGWDEEMAVEMLSRDSSVENVQVDYRVELLSAPFLLGMMPTTVPDDTDFSQQWHLDSLPFHGQFVSLANSIDVDVDIDAPEAWTVMTGMFDTTMIATVGVIDSGCGENGVFDTNTGYDPGHIDLPNSVLFANTSELPADGNDSADANSLKDDANGWDFAFSDNIPADDDTTANYHGTLISGIIGAAWDNGQGVAGIGKGQLEVLPLRFANSFFEVIAAVEYAMDLVDDGHAVRVLNMSFKSDGGDPFGLRDAVKLAQTYDIAVVAAAGNDFGNNNDDFLDRVWPAEYTRDPSISNVLAVGSTGSTGFLSVFSNIGPGSVQVAAPGENIYSTYSGSSVYAFADGTSFSTPIAGAVLGLVMAANFSLSPAEAIDRIIQGGDFDARLAGLIESGKRVNLAGALAPFAPYSGLAYLDSTVNISMHADSISQSYGTILTSDRDVSWSTTPAAANMTSAGASTLILTPTAPGIAQFTLIFTGASAPVGTYDTGPWRVTAIRPFTAQVRVGETVTFTPILTSSPSWAVTNPAVASISSAGVLTGLSEGLTRVILSDGGVEKDYSGWVLVLPGSTPSGGSNGGGCFGITSSPKDNQWPGAMEMMLVGMILMLIRRRWMAMTSPTSNVQCPTKPA